MEKNKTVSSNVFSLWPYTEHSYQLIKSYKEHNNKILGYYFAHEIKNFILQNISCINEYNSCIIPIPANPKHKRLRGFDHVLLLCRYLQSMVYFPVIPCIGRRESLEQKKLDKRQRKENMQKNLFIKKSKINTTLLHCKYIILLDDIITTGSTIESVMALLTNMNINRESQYCTISLLRTEY